VKKYIAITLLLLTNNSVAIDLDIGEEINEVCAGCHGEYAEGGKDGEYPRLAGLPIKYLEKELRLFKSHERLNHPMVPYTKERELPEEDLLNVSAYINRIKLYSKLPPIIDKDNFNAYERLLLSERLLNIARIDGDYAGGKLIYNNECKSCHGQNGEGKEKKDIPFLAGQYSKYLLKQINAYQSGERVHDEEASSDSIFIGYSSTDLNNLLAYISLLDDK
jgi:cytochrome c553